MYKVLAVVGPTAVGKSSAGIRLAKQFNGEIINGDSIQVYRQLNIGSAKITDEEMQGVKHHLISCRDLNEDYNVKEFQEEARKIIEEIAGRGKLPIIVGGTGLYIKAILYDYDFVETTESVEDHSDDTTDSLYEKLRLLDPISAEKIHPNNRKRILRSLQMAEKGTLKSEQEAAQNHEMIYDAFLAGLTISREILKQQIADRVRKMFDDGLVQEVTELNSKYSWNEHGLQGIGYKEFKEYFNGNQSLEETENQIIIHTRQFAKRQYTWWNNQMPVRWYDREIDDWYENMAGDIGRWLNG